MMEARDSQAPFTPLTTWHFLFYLNGKTLKTYCCGRIYTFGKTDHYSLVLCWLGDKLKFWCSDFYL